jgi:hypothetical protein
MWWSIRGRCRRLAAAGLLVLFAGLAPARPARQTGEARDYAKIFGRNYRQALDFIQRNRRIDETFRICDIDPAFAWAVVFPEMIRWSALSDVIETSNLRALYVQFGKGYSDFSVGRFQMKPSFAETLESDFNRLLDRSEKERIGLAAFETADSVESRRARVERLTDLDGQVRYLIAFIRVMERIYARETWPSVEDKLRFFATAYNTGYRRGAAVLKRDSTLLRFHTGIIFSKPAYSYAGIALDFFRKFPSI